MKKIVLVSIACLFALISSAQLKVDSLGRVTVKKAPVSTDSYTSLPSDRKNLLSMHVFGEHGRCKAGAKLAFGDFVDRDAGGFNVMVGEYTDSLDTDQLWLHGKNGVYFTRKSAVLENPAHTIAHYNDNEGNNFYFNCEVYAQGFHVSSDRSLKTNITNMESALSQIQKVQGVSYNLKSTASVKPIQQSAPRFSSEKEQQDYLIEQKFQELEKKRLEKKRMGFIAQDIQKIFPELVEENKDGILSVDYIGLIPVLVEAIKEQQDQIDELKTRIPPSNSLRSLFSTDSAEEMSETKSINDDVMKGIALYQNVPNPFNSRTEIQYSLTGEEKNAFIYVFNMQGSLQKRYNADSSGSLIIEAAELTPGMYIYSLVVDGKEVDAKRMILTN